MRSEFRAKLNIPLCLAAVLLCMTLVSVYLVSGLFARYTAKGTSDNAAAVAAFTPLAAFEEDTWVFEHDGSVSYSFTYQLALSNPSEVDVRCGLTISFPDRLLDGAVFTFMDVQKENTNGTAIDFGEFASLAAGDTAGIVQTLKITIDEECYNNIMASHDGQTDSLAAHFEAVVSFTQID